MSSGAQERPLAGAGWGGRVELRVEAPRRQGCGGAERRGLGEARAFSLRWVSSALTSHGSSLPGRAASGRVRLAGAAVGSVEYKGVKQDFIAIRKLNVTNLHFT